MHRRQFLQVGGLCAVGSGAGCLAAPMTADSTADDRIHTCSSDGTVRAIGEENGEPVTRWAFDARTTSEKSDPVRGGRNVA